MKRGCWGEWGGHALDSKGERRSVEREGAWRGRCAVSAHTLAIWQGPTRFRRSDGFRRLLRPGVATAGEGGGREGVGEKSASWHVEPPCRQSH